MKQSVSESKLTSLYSTLIKHTIIKQIFDTSIYHDEPPYYCYTTKLEKNPPPLTKLGYTTNTYFTTANGISFFSDYDALWCCVGETIERLCISTYQENAIKYGTYDQMKCVSDCIIDPKQYSGKTLSRSVLYGWVEGICITKKQKTCQIPAQFIYLNYKSAHPKEPMLQPNISSGAAGYTNKTYAIVKAIYELIERDAVLTTYFGKISLPLIDVSKLRSKSIRTINRLLKKYRLRWLALDATTDLNIPVVISLLIDESGNDPKYTFGSSCNLNIDQAVISSVSEACMIRPVSRRVLYAKTRKSDISNKPVTLEERVRYWNQKDAEQKLQFWLTSNKKSNRMNKDTSSMQADYDTLLALLARKGYDIYIKDVTHPIFKDQYYVYKAVIPKLQSLYFDETQPFINRLRIKKVHKQLTKGNEKLHKINTIPHPFL